MNGDGCFAALVAGLLCGLVFVGLVVVVVWLI